MRLRYNTMSYIIIDMYSLKNYYYVIVNSLILIYENQLNAYKGPQLQLKSRLKIMSCFRKKKKDKLVNS